MQFNIFRDRHEREFSSGSKPGGCVRFGGDRPEYRDENVVLRLQEQARNGKPDRTAMLEVLDRLKRITPSSPLWKD